jgi:acyl-CoA thioesterase FadM
MNEVSVSLPRSAFTPREAARAGDVWRLFQDVAVEGSMACGWPPERYRAEGVSFIVRSMVVVHHREAIYGERLVGRTWPSRFRRGMFFRRECRVGAPAGPVASATQEWVHVTSSVELAKASDELVAAFAVEEHEPSVEMPSYDAHEPSGRAHRFELECWHTWMDPLGHVNHPAYVDWCDEATSRAMVEAGLDPVRLMPVAELAHFKAGVVAGDVVVVTTRVVGRTGSGDVVLEHRVAVGDRPCAKVVAIRRLAGELGTSALLSLA